MIASDLRRSAKKYMIRFLRISVLIAASVLAILVAVKVWHGVRTPSLNLKIHVSSLALGFSLLLGVAIQDALRVLFDRSEKDFNLLTWVRLVAAVTASIGYLFGFAWAFASGRAEALLRPVLLTDTAVIVLAWMVTVQGFGRRSTIYRDLVVGIGVLLTWYLATIK